MIMEDLFKTFGEVFNPNPDKPLEVEPKNWSEPDSDGIIHVPDEHDNLVNSIAFQHKLHTISQRFGENEMYCRMAYVAEKHFKKLYKTNEATL